MLNRIVQDLQREAQRKPSTQKHYATPEDRHPHRVATLTERERDHLYAFMAGDLGIWRIDQRHSCLESRCDLLPDGIVGFTLPGRPHDQVRICRASGQHHLCGKHKCRYMIRGSWSIHRHRPRNAADINDNHQWYCLFTHYPKDTDLVSEDWKLDEESGGRMGGGGGDADRETRDAWIRDMTSKYIFERSLYGDGDEEEEAAEEISSDDEERGEGEEGPGPAKRPCVQSENVSASAHALSMLGDVQRPRGRKSFTSSKRSRASPILSFEADAIKRIMAQPGLRRHIFFHPALSADVGDCDWWELSRTWPSVRLQGIPRDHDESEVHYQGRFMDIMSYVETDMNCIQPNVRYIAAFDLKTLHATWDAAGAMFYKTLHRTSVPVICEDYYWNDRHTSGIVQTYIRRMEDMKARREHEARLKTVPDAPPRLSSEHMPAMTGPSLTNVLNFYTTSWNRDGLPMNRSELIQKCTLARIDLSPALTALTVLILDMASRPSQFATVALKRSGGAAASYSRRFGWFSLCAALIGAPDMSCPDMYWWNRGTSNSPLTIARDNDTEKASEVLQNYLSLSLSEICDQVVYICIHRLPRATGYVKDCNQKQISNMLGKTS